MGITGKQLHLKDIKFHLLTINIRLHQIATKRSACLYTDLIIIGIAYKTQ